MKTVCILLFLGIIGFLQAQNPVKTEPGRSGNCEDLVFNTLEMTPFAYNTRCKTEAYPFISNDGSHLYFTNNQSREWLFYSHKDSLSKVWSVPVPLSIAGFDKPIRASYFSSDLKILYFVSGNTLYKAESIGNSKTEFFSAATIDIINNSTYSDEEVQPFSYISFTEDKSQMFAYTGISYRKSETQNKSGFDNTMAYYIKTSDNVYTFVKFISLGKSEGGVLSRDGLSYYYTNDDFHNVLFCRKRPTLNEEFGPEIYTVKVFENHLDINQVRLAEGANKMVLVLSENSWEKNDIFFYDYSNSDTGLTYKLFDVVAYRQDKESVISDLPVLINEREAPQPLRKVELLSKFGTGIARIEIGNPFPNPAKNQFYIYYNVNGENSLAPPPVIVLLDNSGRIVYTQKLENMHGEVMVNPENLTSGVYYIRIDYNGLSSEISRITLSF